MSKIYDIGKNNPGLQKRQEIDVPAFVRQGTPGRVRNKQKQDEFISTRKAVKKPAHTVRNAYIAGFMTALAAIFSANLYEDVKNYTPDNVTISYDSEDDNLETIAEMYDSSSYIITARNGINENGEGNIQELVVPRKISLLDEKIEDIQDNLYSSKISQEKREEKQEQLNKYNNIKTHQNSVADVYKEDGYTYFVIRPDVDRINVEAFKNLFAIKDGAIKKNNEISYKYVEDKNYSGGGYIDWSEANLYAGDTIKVKNNQIDLDKIEETFDEYFKYIQNM